MNEENQKSETEDIKGIASTMSDDTSDTQEVRKSLSESDLKLRRLHNFNEYAILLAIVMTIAFVVTNFISFRAVVDGKSMTNTLADGDNLVIERVSYWFGKAPERFDIVIIDIDKATETYYVKRVIGLPGETIQIIDGFVYINGEKLTSDIYGKDIIQSPGIAKTPYKIKDDEVFVMGDNRNNSNDSRFIGPMKISQLEGRAFFRFLPLSSFGTIK